MFARLLCQEVREREGEQRQNGEAPVQRGHGGERAQEEDGTHCQWQQMVPDEDVADSAAAASQAMKMLSGLEPLEVGEANAQEVVEQVAAQAFGDAFANVGAQVVVGGVEACTEDGHDYHADEEEAYQPHIGGGYCCVEELLEEKWLDQPDSRADEREGYEERNPGDLLFQLLLDERKGGFRFFGINGRGHWVRVASATMEYGRARQK